MMIQKQVLMALAAWEMPIMEKIWLEAAISEKIDHVNEINLQHKLREERRNAGFGLWGKSSK
jgi:hypothetical protein